MQRPNAREFLKEVLDSVSGLPEGFAEGFLDLVETETDDRPGEIQRLIEESTRE